MIKYIRYFLGFPKYVDIPYEWVIRKGSEDIAVLSEPEVEDMYWRKVLLTPIAETVNKSDLFKDDYWIDCDYEVRHKTVELEAENVIITAKGEPNHVLVRGIPERVADIKYPKQRKVEGNF